LAWTEGSAGVVTVAELLIRPSDTDGLSFSTAVKVPWTGVIIAGGATYVLVRSPLVSLMVNAADGATLMLLIRFTPFADIFTGAWSPVSDTVPPTSQDIAIFEEPQGHACSPVFEDKMCDVTDATSLSQFAALTCVSIAPEACCPARLERTTWLPDISFDDRGAWSM